MEEEQENRYAFGPRFHIGSKVLHTTNLSHAIHFPIHGPYTCDVIVVVYGLISIFSPNREVSKGRVEIALGFVWSLVNNFSGQKGNFIDQVTLNVPICVLLGKKQWVLEKKKKERKDFKKRGGDLFRRIFIKTQPMNMINK